MQKYISYISSFFLVSLTVNLLGQEKKLTSPHKIATKFDAEIIITKECSELETVFPARGSQYIIAYKCDNKSEIKVIRFYGPSVHSMPDSIIKNNPSVQNTKMENNISIARDSKLILSKTQSEKGTPDIRGNNTHLRRKDLIFFGAEIGYLQQASSLETFIVEDKQYVENYILVLVKGNLITNISLYNEKGSTRRHNEKQALRSFRKTIKFSE